MKLTFIRHGKTQGNIEHRYVGRTDESLCEEGRKAAESKQEYYGLFERADAVFVSPMRRCVETMQMFYNKNSAVPVYEIEDFREYDFGEYEMKNHEELMEYDSYRKWLESNGEYDMPAGEGLACFKKRVVAAFDKSIEICEKNGFENVIYVVHGGTIMSIFEKYDDKELQYYDYMIKNLDCYKAEWQSGKLRRV